jgi:hypothetical protein
MVATAVVITGTETIAEATVLTRFDLPRHRRWHWRPPDRRPQFWRADSDRVDLRP